MKKFIGLMFLVFIGLMFLVFILVGCQQSPTILLVDGEKITHDDLNGEFYSFDTKDISSQQGLIFVLDRVIENKILENEYGEIASIEIKGRMDRIKKDHPNNFEEIMSSMGADSHFESELFIRNLSLLSRAYESFSISEDDIDAEIIYRNSQLVLRSILVSTEEEAQNVISELNQGTDFEKLASEHSLLEESSPGSPSSFDLDSLSLLRGNISLAALDLEEGEHSQHPIENHDGFMVIQLVESYFPTIEDIKDGDIDYEKLRSEIEESIKIDQFEKKLAELKAKTKIEIVFPEIEDSFYRWSEYSPEKDL